MKYYLPNHNDGNNRGCQAITEATSIILSEPSENILVLSNNPLNDISLGLNHNVTLLSCPQESFLFKIKRKVLSIFQKGNYEKECLTYSQKYDEFLDKVENDDIVLSTGGDMLCYHDNEVIYINEKMKLKRHKSILWGCSVGNENLTPRKIETLRKFDFIYVRESMSEEVLKGIGLTNVFRYPDPAFILLPSPFELPYYMNEGDIVGVNLSNFASTSTDIANDYLQNIKHLFNYIINKTKYKIVLIPHVIWENQDDRIVCGKIYDLYKSTGRCFLFESERYNYTQIRYLISKCRFFLGARTHSVISAYSMCIPTVAIGYSIKSIGIAKDLGLSYQTVVDSRKWKTSDDLLNSFKYLESHEKDVTKHLQNIMPDYIRSVYDVRLLLDKIKKSNVK